MDQPVIQKNIFTKDTPVPFYVVVAAAFLFLSIGIFINDQSSRINELDKEVNSVESAYKDEIMSLRNEVKDIRENTGKTVNDINKQLLYIQIIVSKIATKNNIDIKNDLPTTLTLPDALTFEP